MKRTYNSNINCDRCVSTVSTVLNDHEGVKDWEVDLEHPDKKITIDLDPEQEKVILTKLNDLGYILEE